MQFNVMPAMDKCQECGAIDYQESAGCDASGRLASPADVCWRRNSMDACQQADRSGVEQLLQLLRDHMVDRIQKGTGILQLARFRWTC